MIINTDQTPLLFVLISNYSLGEKSTSRVSVPATSDYCQITGAFGITMAGVFLPIKLIHESKTKRIQARFNFTKRVSHYPNIKLIGK